MRGISHTRLDSDTTMSTGFQFSDTIGAGIQFGNQLRSTVGIRFQHLSNASIKSPNPGINFTQLYYQQSF
ncbi:MAG: Lipid A deacylase PagL [Paracidovorax wautersii]|uniref:Lipid A deacylase PagL n=1 Tax=Paracidovorax wautersii TaxID=1177982 RepID=A0A7V8FPG8_9BURK|nr:MAG: Lipid A deacylase PagL [Paracidovorax wautersii]